MANTLMFEVGIKQAIDGLDKVKKELDQFVTDYSKKMQIQVDIKNLEAFIGALKSIGSGEQLKPLLDRIDTLQRRLSSMSSEGQYFDNLRREAVEAAEAVKIAEKQLENIKRTGNTNLIANARLELQNAQKNQVGATEALASASERLSREQKKEGDAALDLNSKIEQLSQSITTLSGKTFSVNMGQEFSNWATEVQAVTRSVKELVAAQNSVAESAAKAGKSEQQIGDSQTAMFNRYNKLLADIRNIKSEIIEIQRSTGGGGPFGEKLGEYYSSINKIRNLVREITSAPSVAEAIQRGMSSELLAKLNSALAALKTNYKEVISDAKSFNKATDKGSSQAEARIRKLGMAFNELKNYMRANGGSEEMRRLQSEIQGAIRKMRELMNAGNFAGAINVYERLSGIIRQAATATKEFERSQQGLSTTISHTNSQLQGQSQILSDLKTMATQYLGVWGAQGFLRNVIEIGGQLEMQRLSIGAILGDMAKATELFDRIKNLAIKSPFGVVELDQMTKQLSAYGFEYNELYDMTKRLADISAATGTSVDRLALALGHVRSEAALSGYTLRQFSMANIPLAKKLSEELTKVEGKLVSVADVRKRVRTKDIGYEQVLKVLKDLTDEGGMFYNAQEIMSESVKARFKNLKDSMDIMYGEIAESKVGGALKEVATMLTTLTRHWQELGAVLIVGAGYWAINRTAMMASNKIMVQANLTAGRFSAAQLEMQAITGNLTRAQLLQAVATKKLAVADAEAAGAVLALSRAQLQHVANTGKVSAALNIATIATSKYSISQLRAMAITKNMGVGATILAYLQRGWIGVSAAATVATTAVWGFMKALWPMLAISAIVEVFMSMKRESEQFADAANYVGQSARNMMKDIDDAMKSVSKNGKPVDTEALRESVNTMKEVVENSEFYTAEQQKQVENAKTLSEKYDILLKQMKEMKEEAEWQTNNEGLIETILENTGKNIKTTTAQNWNGQTGQYETVTSQTFGSRFFNNSLQENIEQVNKSNASLQSAINLLSEYQNVIENAIKKNNNFGLSLDGKNWQEQVRMIAESGKWDEFVSSVENAGSRFEKTASKVKEASDKVNEDWKSIVGDDVKAIRLTLMQEWGMTEDEINQFAKNNERTMRWLVDSIAKSLSKLGVAESVIDEFKQKLLELFGVANNGKPNKKEPNEYEKQTDLGKRLMRNVLNYNKNNGKGGNGVTTVKEINEITGTGDNVKTESEVIKTLKERAQKDHEAMKDVKRIYGETSEQYKKAKKKYEHSLNLAESNGLKESEILTGKYKEKGDSNKLDTERAKAVREEMRIMKEAADSFQYWREKVGDNAAWAHVESEFGDVLERIGVTAKNVKDLRGNIEGLTPKIEKIKDKKVKNETFKEQSKELAQLDRKDFEKTADEFASKVQIELDGLTRAWEIFNSVREATGNIELAVQISGADYASGKTRNLADALKEKIQKDFDAAGGGIAFDMNLSDKDIEESIKRSMPAASEEKIKGLVEEYKKWRDLQRDVLAKDIDMFAKIIGGAQDYNSQIQKINDNLAKQIESLKEVAKNSPGSAQNVNKAIAAANAQAEYDKWKLSSQYSQLMNNSLALTRQEVENGINIAMQHQNELMKNGVISAQQYAEEMEKIRNIQSEWTKNSFFGTNTAWGAGIMGGISGRRDYYKRQAKDASEEVARLEQKRASSGGGLFGSEYSQLIDAKKRASDSESEVKRLDSLEGVFNSFEALSKAMDPVINLFDQLGMSGVGKVLGAGQNALNSAVSMGSGMESILEGAGPYGAAIGAGLSIMGTLIGSHDDALQAEIDELKANNAALEANTEVIKALRGRTLGYDTGDLRRYIASTYNDTSKFNGNLSMQLFGLEPESNRAMRDFYNTNLGGNGYSQELANLKQERENYLAMYDAEADKKDSSEESLAEYKKKIAELDEEIMFFAQDLANELFSIDIKGWADQISDSLMTAFENGEDAAKSFKDTVEDIMKDVVKRMLSVGVIQPMMNKLQKKLFGENGQGGSFDAMNPEGTIDAALRDIVEFFGEGGEGTKAVNAAQTFYNKVESLMNSKGLTLSEKESSNSLSSNIKGITEQTADLLAAYLNAVRADVSVNRAMIAQYYPLFYAAMTGGNASLQNIENHTAAIMRSNDAINRNVEDLRNDFHGLKTGVWKMPIA